MNPAKVSLIFLLCISLLTIGVSPVLASGTEHQPQSSETAQQTPTVVPQTQPPGMNNTTNEPTSTGTIGYWGGVWYNETFSFDSNESAYVNQSQLEKLTNRTIARIEHFRNDTFNRKPPVEVLTRTGYQQSSAANQQMPDQYKEWNNQIWNAMFMIEDNASAQSELNELYGGQVRAFYSPSQQKINLIVPQDQTDLVKFNETSLAHELVHAYQHQKFDLTKPAFNRQTQDGALAKDSVLEGESSYLESRYYQNCQSDTWSCYIPDNGESTTGGGSVHIGLQLTSYFPYSDGHAYIKNIHQNNGWDAVNASYTSSIPTHTSEIIHYTNQTNPTTPTIEENSTVDWETYRYGDDGSERVGESTLAIMYWYQNNEYDIDTQVTNNDLLSTNDSSTYNYNFSVTNGLRGDTILPYYNTDTNEQGYVFQTEWESAYDREQFEQGYRTILLGHNAEPHNTSLNGEVYMTPDESGYSGVYYITQNETTLTVTHSSSLENIKEIRGITKSSKNIGGEPTNVFTEMIEDMSIFTILSLAMFLLCLLSGVFWVVFFE